MPYDVGLVNGTICQDNVVIAGLTLIGHTFGVANQESIDFSSNLTHYDGMMGFGKSVVCIKLRPLFHHSQTDSVNSYQSLSREQTPTPVEALASAGLIPAPIVSYKLGREADNDNDGEITLGFVLVLHCTIVI